MNALTQVTLVSLCLYAQGACGALYPRSSRQGGGGVYSGDSSREYEPYVYAAFPLHGAVPVMHVVSNRPLGRAPASSVHHPVFARPPYQDNDYAAAANDEYEYTSDAYGESQGYGDHYRPSYAPQYGAPAPSATQDDVTILYARPNPHGGFSYRRRPYKTALKRSPPVLTTESPVIIRVHKYRVVRDP